MIGKFGILLRAFTAIGVIFGLALLAEALLHVTWLAANVIAVVAVSSTVVAKLVWDRSGRARTSRYDRAEPRQINRP